MNLPDIYFSHSQMQTTGLAASNGRISFIERLERDSYFIENMQAVADANSLRLLDADTSICPTIELRLYDGHTPGQIVPYIHTEDRTLSLPGMLSPL